SETLFAALLSLLDASYQTGDLQSLDEAIAKLALHYPQTPELPKAYFSRAQVLKRNERFDEAKEALEQLIVQYPSFPQKGQVLFELTHLDFKAKNWEGCYQRGLVFLNAFAGHELCPFVWRYFVSSSSEIAMQKPEHKRQLLVDLEAFLQLPLAAAERSEWQLLQAKTYFELRQYEEAMKCLRSQESPNALLLLSLCYRDGYRDLGQFCKLAEEALARGANLVSLGPIHASLYNAYLELSNMEKAAQHLYEAFMAKADLKAENLLWLADTYYNQLLEEEGNFVIAARAAALYSKVKATEQATCRLAKVYSILGRIDDAIALLEPLSNPSQEAQLILAENYAKKGIVDQAVQIFDAIVSACGTGRSPVAAAAALHGVRLKRAQEKPNWAEIATQLKSLVLQKNFEGEPLYLEAALEYVEVVAKGDPVKTIALLQKTKADFEQRGDLLAKDYHAAREQFPRKNITYQGYMKLIDAQLALNEAKVDRVHQKDLQAKSKTLLLQIMETPIASCLKERVQKLLSDET
ncbi:MAG: hypothetical protein KGQ49_03095, partial [Verrucomicrobia bacterium]|nr:hypothetical protein [Verrucomicrobiota bacterium]